MHAEKDGIVYYCKRPKEADWNEHEIAVHMLKRGFWEYFQMEFREEDVQRREDGKPYYAAKPDLKFNISHCRGGVAVVLSDKEVGIDVEGMRRVNRRMVKKCCSREEMEYVFGRRADSRKEILSRHSVISKKQDREEEKDALQEEEIRRFLHLWTLKESYVKMTGEGLRSSFDRVCFLPWDLQKMEEKEIREIKGVDSMCRHYVYSSGELMMALTVQWKKEKGDPDFMWREGFSFLE